MHEKFCIKVPETLDTKAFIAPITIMTRSPVAKQDLYKKYTPNFPNLNPPVYSNLKTLICLYFIIYINLLLKNKKLLKLEFFINIFSTTYFDY